MTGWIRRWMPYRARNSVHVGCGWPAGRPTDGRLTAFLIDDRYWTLRRHAYPILHLRVSIPRSKLEQPFARTSRFVPRIAPPPPFNLFRNTERLRLVQLFFPETRFTFHFKKHKAATIENVKEVHRLKKDPSVNTSEEKKDWRETFEQTKSNSLKGCPTNAIVSPLTTRDEKTRNPWRTSRWIRSTKGTEEEKLLEEKSQDLKFKN